MSDFETNLSPSTPQGIDRCLNELQHATVQLLNQRTILTSMVLKINGSDAPAPSTEKAELKPQKSSGNAGEMEERLNHLQEIINQNHDLLHRLNIFINAPT